MKTFKEFLIEAAVPSTGNELAEALKTVIKKHFPKSFIQSNFSTNISAAVMIKFAFGLNQSDWPNGIIQNDPLFHQFTIRGGFNNEGKIIEKNLTTDILVGGRLSKGGRGLIAKLPWRKKSGNVSAILKHFDVYFGRIKKIFEENKDKLED